MTERRIRTCVAIALSATLLAGCGSSPDATVDPNRLTIAELLGQNVQLTDEQYRENDERVQELVADCMAEQGWEYIPVSQPDDYFVYDDTTELERRQREGYGIAYWTLNRGNDDVPIDDPTPVWVDPNAAYVESLTDSEREAYNEALYGTMLLYSTDGARAEESSIIIDPAPSIGDDRGCYGEASDEVYGVTPTYDDAYWEATNLFYEELNERVLADPRIKALDQTWASCMSTTGYPYDTPGDIWEVAYPEFQARHDDIVGDDFYADPFEGWTQDQIDTFFESATQEEIDAMYNVQVELTDQQRAGLEALLADEIDLAVAEWGCTKPHDDNYQSTYAQIEEEYAIEHRAEIEAIVLEWSE
jgi:hypothetical protein